MNEGRKMKTPIHIGVKSEISMTAECWNIEIPFLFDDKKFMEDLIL